MLREAITDAVPGAEVTTVRPDDLGKGGGQTTGINVYLFQATTNPSLRNETFPYRDGGGAALQGAFVPLDLHYIVTFYGKEERHEPEQLYALCAQILGRASALDADRIARTVEGAAGAILAGSDLGAQTERIRLAPYNLTLEELQRTWSLFTPTPYRLSCVYTASVVVLTVDAAPGRALPVRTARTEGVGGPPPKILGLDPTRLPYAPGATVTVVTDSTNAAAFVDDVPAATRRVGTGLVLELPEGVPAGRVAIRLGIAREEGPPIPTTDPVELIVQPLVGGAPRVDEYRGDPIVVVAPQPAPRPGQSVRLLLSPVERPGRGFSSDDVLSFGLAARLIGGDGEPSESLRNAFAQNGHTLPADARIVSLGAEQRIRSDSPPSLEFALRAQGDGLVAYHGLSSEDPEGAMAFAFSLLPKGRYLVRVVVDGVESPLARVEGVYVGPILEVV